MKIRTPQFVLALALLACHLLEQAVAAPEKAKVFVSIAEKVHPFDLNQVQLLDGPFKHAQELERQFLNKTDVNQLLSPFRREAKLPNPAKGSDPLGWPTTGHFMGHYLSGCALTYRSLGDKELKKRADNEDL